MLIKISLIIIVLIVMFILLAGPRYWVRKQGLFGTGKRDFDLDLEQHNHIRNRVDSLLVELQEINREVIGRLDSKIRVLNTLILQANESVASYKKVKDDVDTKIEHFEKLILQQKELQVNASAREDDNADEISEDDTKKNEDPAQNPQALAAINEATEAINTQYEAIYKLYDDGHDSLAIATEMDMQRGEIDFILRLRPTTNS